MTQRQGAFITLVFFIAVVVLSFWAAKDKAPPKQATLEQMEYCTQQCSKLKGFAVETNAAFCQCTFSYPDSDLRKILDQNENRTCDELADQMKMCFHKDRGDKK